MSTHFRIPFSGFIKRTFDNYDGGKTGRVYSTNPSSSILNDFIPYHALMSGKLLSIYNSKALLYNLDFNSLIGGAVKGYELFFDRIVYGDHWYKLAKKNTVSDYRCRVGQLIVVSKDKIATPLMTLVVNKEHLFNIDKMNPDYSKFFIVISKDFSESDEHSNLYKAFCKYYLSIASKYVDVIHTKSIINFCYKQVPIVPIKPKTIAESRVIYRDLTYNVLKAISNNEYT